MSGARPSTRIAMMGEDRMPAGAEQRGRRIKMPIYFEAELFDQVRRRAEREGSSFGDVVCEIVLRGMGG